MIEKDALTRNWKNSQKNFVKLYILKEQELKEQELITN